MSILLVGGSPSVSSRSGRLLEEIGTRLEQEGLAVDRLQVRDLPAQALLHADFKHPEIVAALRRVERAASIVVARLCTRPPTAAFSKFYRLLPQLACAEKWFCRWPAEAVAAHTLILDYALRPVLASLAPVRCWKAFMPSNSRSSGLRNWASCLIRPSNNACSLAWPSARSAAHPVWNVAQLQSPAASPDCLITHITKGNIMKYLHRLLFLLLVGAVATGFSATASAADNVLRVGYQKYGTLILLKARGTLEQRLAPLA